MKHKIGILHSLIDLTRNLGSPEKDYVILGDGNTSARIDVQTFWVKASGAQMKNIQDFQFTELRTETVLQMLDREVLSDDEITCYLSAAMVETAQLRPSIESLIHALAINLCEAEFVGHTHPTAWVGILSSKQVEEALQGRIFTEQINICGPAALFIPYADPGLPLARQVKTGILRYLDEYGEAPREILLQNHGLFALGKTTKEVENITEMSVRAAKTLQIAYALGGPHFLSQKDITRIRTRADEISRRDQVNQ
jgi:rhamnose utilization protein RhaD (predicted bifunctional aldolase and dehydrogenase)